METTLHVNEFNFINQENEEITKIHWRIININFKENMWQLNCLLLYRDYKDFKKHLLTKVSIKKNFSEYISRQLKEHQHKIRSKTGILLEITVFKWLIVSLTPRKFWLWQQYHFYLF